MRVLTLVLLLAACGDDGPAPDSGVHEHPSFDDVAPTPPESHQVEPEPTPPPAGAPCPQTPCGASGEPCCGYECQPGLHCTPDENAGDNPVAVRVCRPVIIL